MINDNEKVTIGNLLDEDTKKQIVDKIINNDFTDVIIIYREKKTNTLKWDTTIEDWPLMLGLTEILSDLVRDEYAMDKVIKEV